MKESRSQELRRLRREVSNKDREIIVAKGLAALHYFNKKTIESGDIEMRKMWDYMLVFLQEFVKAPKDMTAVNALSALKRKQRTDAKIEAETPKSRNQKELAGKIGMSESSLSHAKRRRKS